MAEAVKKTAAKISPPEALAQRLDEGADSQERPPRCAPRHVRARGAEDQIADTSDFITMQDPVTRRCFGEPWTRPVLACGATKNSVSKEELSELTLHAVIYCGLPKAVEGFRTAQGVLNDMGLE